ncbi:MAG: DoxX family protein [Bacteroidetes bacterium]|nr:DoxX family protein [Bacteroidota bacterium]
MNTTEISKTRKLIGWVIASLLTALYLWSASGKLFMHPEQMEQLKLDDWRIIIALGEIGSALLFLFPKTNKFGTLLLSSYMGGAIIIHMTGGMSIIMPSVVLILVWVVAFLRNPELLLNFKTKIVI